MNQTLIERCNAAVTPHGWSVEPVNLGRKSGAELRNRNGNIVSTILFERGRVRVYDSNGTLRGSLSCPESLAQYIERYYYAQRRS